ncbi:MAG: capsule biosynthesis protein [Acidithiobacillus sp.]
MSVQPCMHVLFLQGMPSPFFYRIAQKLETHGCRATRINLCAGDRLFWPGKNAVDYRSTTAAWPDFVRTFMRTQNVTDLVLLGEQRRYHREAVVIALEMGVTVTVTDFGYIRPDWVTWERNGMSGSSLFPRDPAVIRAMAANAPEVDWPPRFFDNALIMAKGDLLHNFANMFGMFLYPHYQRSDRRPSTLLYTAASGLRLLGNRIQRDKNQRKVAHLANNGIRYFLFPLQLDFDFQIVAYSPFSGMAEAIRLVMRSFAAHAEPEDHLILKEHPWDPAIRNLEHFAYREAEALGIRHQVDYLRGGHLDTLIRHARAVVLVNSSTGIRTLQLRKPLKTLGQALFDISGLTHQGSLDTFWKEPGEIDPDLAEAFLKVLAATIQIRGVFFQEPGLSHAIDEALQRLLSGTVGQLQHRATRSCYAESKAQRDTLATISK